MIRARRWSPLLGVALVVATFAACDLNPQPLPPLDPNYAGGAADAGQLSSDGGRSTSNPPPQAATDAGDQDPETPSDAGAVPNDGGVQGESDAGDAGDGGDAG